MKKILAVLLVLILALGNVSFAEKDDLDKSISRQGEIGREEKQVEVEELAGREKILSGPRATVYQMAQWASQEKFKADPDFIALAPLFYKISREYGLDPAVTYAQSAKETNFMRYTGVIPKSYYNTCGLKTKEGGGNYDLSAHAKFSSWEIGVRAQVHHLALYAGHKDFPMADSPDPRHFPWIHGSAPHVEELGGKWAPSKTYGYEVLEMIEAMNTFPASPSKATVKRLAGSNRYETAAEINKFLKTDSRSAVVSSGESFSDSLTATTLAKATDSKLYLLPPKRTTAEFEKAIANRQIDRVYIVGETKALGSHLESLLKKNKIAYERIGGKNRYETANSIVEKIKAFNIQKGRDNQNKLALLTTGENFADAISISPVAVQRNYPIFLTGSKKIPDSTFNKLKSYREVLIVGGENAVSSDIEKALVRAGLKVKRISGSNRYETSLKIAKEFYPLNLSVTFARGRDFPDSLAGVALADKNGGPTILTESSLHKNVREYLMASKTSKIFITGGETALSAKFERDLTRISYK